jgi:hypothetical protein
MASCGDMKKGDIYYCKGCGLELTVTKECKDCGKPGLACACGPCTLICCNEALQLKK